MKHYELSLHAYEYMYTRFLSHLEVSLKKIDDDSTKYAKDLETIGQKRIRAVNNAVRQSVTETQRHFELGLKALEDVCRDRDRAFHWNVRVGEVIKTYYIPKEDRKQWRSFLIKELRSMYRMSKSAIF